MRPKPGEEVLIAGRIEKKKEKATRVIGKGLSSCVLYNTACPNDKLTGATQVDKIIQGTLARDGQQVAIGFISMIAGRDGGALLPWRCLWLCPERQRRALNIGAPGIDGQLVSAACMLRLVKCFGSSATGIIH